MSANCSVSHSKTAKCLLYKLFVMENARKKLEEQMRHFTKKANEDVQLFFQTATARSSVDCLHVLKALEAKCYIIEKVSDFFQQLKADPESHSIMPAKSKDSPISKPVWRQGSDTTVSDILKSGPMLHEFVTAVSARSAGQTVGSASALPQTSPTQTSHESVEICDTSLEHLEEKVPADDGEEMLHSVAPVKSCDSAAGVENPTMQPNGQKLNHGANAVLDDQGPGRDIVLKHQKQTSSELRRFLQSNYKYRAAEFTFIQGKDATAEGSPSFPSASSKIPTQLEMNGRQFCDRKCKERNDIKKKPFCTLASFEPVFKVKQNETENLVSLSYMVATDSEVWDVADVPMGEKHSLFSGWNGQSLEVSHMERIPSFPIRKYEETKVTVSHVVTPENFYIQHVGSELQQMSARIELSCGGSFAEMRCIPDIGAKVVGWFPRDKLWCRIVVLGISGMNGDATLSSGSPGVMENIEVEVRRIDYGDTACLPLQSIKELDDSTATVPVQALQVSLANVSPANGHEWSTEAVDWFKDKVNSTILYARVFPQDTRVTVELFTEKGKMGAMRRSASLSVRLAQSGHAKHTAKEVNLKSCACEPARKVASEWEKYLLSYYSKNKK
ncbi:uncharacterized protein LOC108931004 isoform X2 [Scleropages formosus]|uniref:uncharacterized protein LOC108931004 isoform X2 n=1 Tax=Scleropages formosus TaxID=113540 RepID=UPI0008785C22|nr:uncharacterized protein LOC108931004 isoform X2 [Scleropages formosus]